MPFVGGVKSLCTSLWLPRVKYIFRSWQMLLTAFSPRTSLCTTTRSSDVFLTWLSVRRATLPATMRLRCSGGETSKLDQLSCKRTPAHTCCQWNKMSETNRTRINRVLVIACIGVSRLWKKTIVFIMWECQTCLTNSSKTVTQGIRAAAPRLSALFNCNQIHSGFESCLSAALREKKSVYPVAPCHCLSLLAKLTRRLWRWCRSAWGPVSRGREAAMSRTVPRSCSSSPRFQRTSKLAVSDHPFAEACATQVHKWRRTMYKIVT